MRFSLALVIFFGSGAIQWWLMVSSLSDWLGSLLAAVAISFIGAWVPIPWFVICHWYIEGHLPWTYLALWVIGWGAVGLAAKGDGRH